jgi:hypothetical protein
MTVWYKNAGLKRDRIRSGIVDATDERRSGPCETCGRETPSLHMDHDHATGLKRGWLCGSCNRALGLVKDNTQTLQRMLDYLKK